MFQCAGLNLSQALGDVPPRVPTDPVRTWRNHSVRAACQPPRFPEPVERHVWEAKRLPASPTRSATSASLPASIPHSSAAHSKLNSAYASLSTSRNSSKVWGRSGWRSAIVCSQLTHRRMKVRSIWSVSSRCRAMERNMAGSVPGQVESQMSDIDAVLERRGSIVQSFAPACFASMIRWACGLK